MKFIIVGCGWFVDLNRFYISEFIGTKEDAEKEAMCLKGKHTDTFNRCEFRVIPIKEIETISIGTKLSLKQRITGRY